MTTAVKRPVLRYHGGKWQLAPWILSYFPAHRVYVEPFAGAASVLLRKPRAYVDVYNDLDEQVVNVFRVLRDPRTAAQLRDAIAFTPFARVEFEEAYQGAAAADPVERARLTIIRAYMGFGSASQYAGHATGFRSNGNRNGNHPAADWKNWPAQVEAFTERLRGCVIECRTAADVIAQHDGPDTLHYVDPPYVLTTRGTTKGVRQKYRNEMTDDDHRALAAQLRCVEGRVVLSGYACSLYDQELYPDWHRVERSAFADGARPRIEVLWLNFVPAFGLFSPTPEPR